MHASDVTPEIAAHANELYWESDRSVNQIADELDLSKGALYAALMALGSGSGCPRCGDEAGWPNRTARDQEQLACATCSWSGNASQTTIYDHGASLEQSQNSGVNDLVESVGEYPPVPTDPPGSYRFTKIAGGAMLGAAVGLALVLWARRR